MVWIKSPRANKHHMELKKCLKIDLFSDEYKVLCKIGEGSFAEVLKCLDRQSGISIAAKQLKRKYKSAALADEIPELIAMRKLTRHPNILHMIESHYEKEQGRVTFVFELMDMSLYDLITYRKKSIPENKAKHYLYQIVKGIDHIHHHGIFHRDIKPENILIKGDILKISDLGSIKGIYTKQPYTEYISTRWYRSPECLLTKGYYGPKMDVWAIGCVFFELLTLKPLFPGETSVDQIARINNVLGTPNPRLLTKFKRFNQWNCDINFPAKQGTGLNMLIPFITDYGRDILKQMIVYDPDSRINIRRLVDHKYFEDIRDYSNNAKGNFSCTMIGSGSLNKTNWRNPALMSFLTCEKNRKTKIACVQKKASEEKLNINCESSSNLNRINLRQSSIINKSSDLTGGHRNLKLASNSLIPLKEKINTMNYHNEVKRVGESCSLYEKIKAMKSGINLNSKFENNKQLVSTKLPPLIHEGIGRKEIQMVKLATTRSLHKGNILRELMQPNRK